MDLICDETDRVESKLKLGVPYISEASIVSLVVKEDKMGECFKSC